MAFFLDGAPRRGTWRRGGRGFTLVEMLVVITIIAILGGLALTALSVARKRSQVNRVQLMLTRLATGIERYYTDFSEYPSSDGEDGVHGSERLLEALETEEMDGPYIEKQGFVFSDVNHNGMKEIADVWGRPIHYLHSRDYGREKPNPHTYRLVSAGLDGVFDELYSKSDDIVNWNKSEDSEE